MTQPTRTRGVRERKCPHPQRKGKLCLGGQDPETPTGFTRSRFPASDKRPKVTMLKQIKVDFSGVSNPEVSSSGCHLPLFCDVSGPSSFLTDQEGDTEQKGSRVSAQAVQHKVLG